MEVPMEAEELISELQSIAQNVRQIERADWKDQKTVTEYTLGRLNGLCQKLSMPAMPTEGVSAIHRTIVVVDSSVASQMSRALDLALGEA